MDSNLDPSICRDFLRNVCNRGSRCKFKHITQQECELLRASQSTTPICHDYMNGACSRVNCKFLHTVQSQETSILVQQYDKNNDTSIPYCKDFIKGQCRRGALCKFRHISGKDKNLQRLPNQQQQQMISVSNSGSSQTTIMPVAASCNGQQLYIKLENQNHQTSVPPPPSSFQQYPNPGTFYAAVSGAPHQIHHLTASMPSAIVDSRLLTTTLPGIPVVMASNQTRQATAHGAPIMSNENDRLNEVIDRIPSVSGTAAAAMAAASVFVQSSTKNSENDRNNHLLNSDALNQLMPTILSSAVAGANAFAQQGNQTKTSQVSMNLHSSTIHGSQQHSNSKEISNSPENQKNDELDRKSETLESTKSRSEGKQTETSNQEPGEEKSDAEASSKSDDKTEEKSAESKLSVAKENSSNSKEKVDPNSIDQLRSSMAMTAAAVAAVAAAAAVEHHHMKQQNQQVQHSVSNGGLVLQSQMTCGSDTLATISSSPTSNAGPALLSSIGPMNSYRPVSNRDLSNNQTGQHHVHHHAPGPSQMTFIQSGTPNNPSNPSNQPPIISTMIQPISESPQQQQSLCFLTPISSNTQSVLVATSSASSTPTPNSTVSTHPASVQDTGGEQRTEALLRLSEARFNRKIRQVELLHLLNQAHSTGAQYMDSGGDGECCQDDEGSLETGNPMKKKKTKRDLLMSETGEENGKDAGQRSPSMNGKAERMHDRIITRQKRNVFRRNRLRLTSHPSYLGDYDETDEIEDMYLSEDYETFLQSPEDWHDQNHHEEEDEPTRDEKTPTPTSPPPSVNEEPTHHETSIPTVNEKNGGEKNVCDGENKNGGAPQSSFEKGKGVQGRSKIKKRQSLICLLDSLKDSLKEPEKLCSLKMVKRHLSLLKAENSKLKLKLNNMAHQNNELWTHNKLLLDQNIRLRESSKQVVAASRATENAAAAVEAQVTHQSTTSHTTPFNSIHTFYKAKNIVPNDFNNHNR